MNANIVIEYFVEEEPYRGNVYIKYSFKYNPEEYKKELIEEIKRIINEYSGLIRLDIRAELVHLNISV